MRIALFSTCIVDGMYPRVARATVEILERLGPRGCLPPEPDLLLSDARQLPATSMTVTKSSRTTLKLSTPGTGT